VGRVGRVRFIGMRVGRRRVPEVDPRPGDVVREFAPQPGRFPLESSQLFLLVPEPEPVPEPGRRRRNDDERIMVRETLRLPQPVRFALQRADQRTGMRQLILDHFVRTQRVCDGLFCFTSRFLDVSVAHSAADLDKSRLVLGHNIQVNSKMLHLRRYMRNTRDAFHRDANFRESKTASPVITTPTIILRTTPEVGNDVMSERETTVLV